MLKAAVFMPKTRTCYGKFVLISRFRPLVCYHLLSKQMTFFNDFNDNNNNNDSKDSNDNNDDNKSKK